VQSRKVGQSFVRAEMVRDYGDSASESQAADREVASGGDVG
jgi:hypothetical protein